MVHSIETFVLVWSVLFASNRSNPVYMYYLALIGCRIDGCVTFSEWFTLIWGNETFAWLFGHFGFDCLILGQHVYWLNGGAGKRGCGRRVWRTRWAYRSWWGWNSVGFTAKAGAGINYLRYTVAWTTCSTASTARWTPTWEQSVGNRLENNYAT